MAAPVNLSILAALASPRSVNQLASDAKATHEAARKACRALETWGLVRTVRQGRRRLVTAASPTLAPLARDLLDRTSHGGLVQAFHGDRPLMLHVLDHTEGVDLAAAVMGKARSTVYHFIAQAGPAGLLQKTANGYRIHRTQAALRQLVEEWSRLAVHHALRSHDPMARVVWHLGPEGLFTSMADIRARGIRPAGLSAFAGHGILVETGARTTYALARRDHDAADHVLQAIVADPSARKVRNLSALLYEAAGRPALAAKARIYGLEREARSLAAFVDDRADQPGFLPWREHERLRRLYGVTA